MIKTCSSKTKMTYAAKLMVLINLTQRITMGFNFWIFANPQKEVIKWMDLRISGDDYNPMIINGTNTTYLLEVKNSCGSGNDDTSNDLHKKGLSTFALMLGLSTWMGLIGSIFSSLLTEWKDANTTMITSSILCIIAEFLCFSSMHFTKSLPLFFTGQMLIGIVNGAQNIAPAAYLNEISNIKNRAAFSSSTGVCSKIGGILTMIIGMDPVLGSIEKIKYLFLIPIIPSFLHLILARNFIIRSPAQLKKLRYSQKTVDAAIKTLYGHNNVIMDLGDIAIRRTSRTSVMSQMQQIDEVHVDEDVDERYHSTDSEEENENEKEKSPPVIINKVVPLPSERPESNGKAGPPGPPGRRSSIISIASLARKSIISAISQKPPEKPLKSTKISFKQKLKELKDYFHHPPTQRSTVYFLLVTTLGIACGMNEITRYSNQILCTFNFDLVLSQGMTIVMFSFLVVFSVPASYFVDKWSRKKQLSGCAVVTCCLMAFLVIIGQIKETLAIKILAICGFVLVLIAYAIGVGTVLYIIPGEVTPYRFKSLAYSIERVYYYILSGTLTYIFPLIYDNIGSYTFIIFCVVNLLAAFYFYFFTVETRRRSSIDTQRAFSRRNSLFGIS